jgi:hypothetical protein
MFIFIVTLLSISFVVLVLFWLCLLILFEQDMEKPCDYSDAIDEWHESDSQLPLHEYLGMDREEYARKVLKSN